MAALGAPRPLPRVPAEVSSPNRERPLTLRRMHRDCNQIYPLIQLVMKNRSITLTEKLGNGGNCQNLRANSPDTPISRSGCAADPGSDVTMRVWQSRGGQQLYG